MDIRVTSWRDPGNDIKILTDILVNIHLRLVHLHVEVRSEELLAPALLCHKEPARAPIIGPFRAWKPPNPYAIKNQRGASKIGVFCVPKPPTNYATSWLFMA